MNSFSGLLNNSALMLILCVIYDTFNIHAIKKRYLRDAVTGILVGSIAIAVMLSPWSLTPGVFLRFCIAAGMASTVTLIVLTGMSGKAAILKLDAQNSRLKIFWQIQLNPMPAFWLHT